MCTLATEWCFWTCGLVLSPPPELAPVGAVQRRLTFSAGMGIDSKHSGWNTPCHRIDYDFTPLAIETGGRQVEATERILCRVIDIAGAGGASDRARFHHYAASRIFMTNTIGVAKTIIAKEACRVRRPSGILPTLPWICPPTVE